MSALLSAWAGLLSQWDAWSAEEDSAALAVIDAAVEKQVRNGAAHRRTVKRNACSVSHLFKFDVKNDLIFRLNPAH